jgi:Yip1-like protein
MTILSGVGRPAPLYSPAESLFARVFGIIHSPRATFQAVAQAPRWLAVVTSTFLLTAGCTAILLETDVGQLALLDQWERTASAFGQAIDEGQYAAMEAASQNGSAYAALSSLVSGPVLTVALSALFFASFRARRVTFRQVLAVVAHAGIILALRQMIAAPITYARETLASPMTMSMFFSMLDEASLPARFFGIIDLFVIWWMVVLAIGLSVLYQRPAHRLAFAFVGAYVTLAVVLAVVMAVAGGTA